MGDSFTHLPARSVPVKAPDGQTSLVQSRTLEPLHPNPISPCLAIAVNGILLDAPATDLRGSSFSHTCVHMSADPVGCTSKYSQNRPPSFLPSPHPNPGLCCCIPQLKMPPGPVQAPPGARRPGAPALLPPLGLQATTVSSTVLPPHGPRCPSPPRRLVPQDFGRRILWSQRHLKNSRCGKGSLISPFLPESRR